jgi:molybdate transport system substrate-binding protein
MVERNETPIGLIYRTDALNSKKVKIVFTFQNTSLNQIEYIMAIVQSKERPAVKAYYNFIMSPEVKHIYARFGFELP